MPIGEIASHESCLTYSGTLESGSLSGASPVGLWPLSDPHPGTLLISGARDEDTKDSSLACAQGWSK
jgi:hypothetical protein